MNISCDKPNTYGTIRPPPFFSAETTITIGVQAPTGIHGETIPIYTCSGRNHDYNRCTSTLKLKLVCMESCNTVLVG